MPQGAQSYEVRTLPRAPVQERFLVQLRTDQRTKCGENLAHRTIKPALRVEFLIGP